MTLPAWVAWLAVTVLFFGAFLSGIRPGRWYYSRLLPLAGSGLAAFVTMPCFMYLGDVAWLAPILVIDAWLVAVILFVARTRDYS
jgi:hypothetical protein